MLFCSLEFMFLFLPLTCLAFYASRRLFGDTPALGLLLLASVVFYAYWKPIYLPLLAGSILGNFLLSRQIRGHDRRSLVWLTVAIVANLGLLFFFKYAAFASSVATDLGWLRAPLAKRALPLGISFFTFTQMTYLVDRYKGTAPATSLMRYALFVTFFPHLIAGPILHHQQIMPQLKRPRVNRDMVAAGLFIFAVGLAKKVVIADPLGQMADFGFAHVPTLTSLESWTTLLSYTLQLYFDFSGYSDMAVGLSRLFGVYLPWNFISPYKCASIADFWRRWHVTLSVFLRDYVYIPLGGSHVGRVRRSLNLLATLLLGAIWHGAGYTFLVWGALHGLALVVNHFWRDLKLPMPPVLGWCLTMALVMAGWAFFRAASVADACALLHQLVTPHFAWSQLNRRLQTVAVYLLVGVVLALACPNTKELSERYRPTVPWILWTAALYVVSMIYILGPAAPTEFLYFEF